LVNVPGGVADWPIRVFAIAGWRHDPGDLRQLSALHVTSELVEQVLSSIRASAGAGPVGIMLTISVPVAPYWNSGEFGAASAYCLKHSSELSVKLPAKELRVPSPKSREKVCPARS
jgi:hypothetical protein